MNFPLVAAERVVDWEALDNHILTARSSFDRRCWPAVRQYAQSLCLLDGIPSRQAQKRLDSAVLAATTRTYTFGYESASRELRALRSRRPSTPGLIAAAIPDHPYASQAFCHRLAQQAAGAITGALVAYYPRTAESEDDMQRLVRLEEKGRGYLHNAGMELVGRALNAGRTLAALGGDRPTMTAREAPALYAMRSEQLDRATCAKCKKLHGRVVKVGTKRYFELMPPNLCVTADIPGLGARCRGVYVYGDSPDDFKES